SLPDPDPRRRCHSAADPGRPHAPRHQPDGQGAHLQSRVRLPCALRRAGHLQRPDESDPSPRRLRSGVGHLALSTWPLNIRFPNQGLFTAKRQPSIANCRSSHHPAPPHRSAKSQITKYKSQTTKMPGLSPRLFPKCKCCRSAYEVLRGCIVRSRTCPRMLDHCMPFSLLTNGTSSAINSSVIRSRISSSRVRAPPFSRSGTPTSSAFASRSSDDNVGVALSFSIFET